MAIINLTFGSRFDLMVPSHTSLVVALHRTDGPNRMTSLGRLLIIAVFLAGLLVIPRWVMTHPDHAQLAELRRDVEILRRDNEQLAQTNRHIKRQAESVHEHTPYQRELARERMQKFPRNAVRVRVR